MTAATVYYKLSKKLTKKVQVLTAELRSTLETKADRNVAKRERPVGLVEACQLALFGKSGQMSMTFQGRTVHVERQAGAGKPGTSPRRCYRWVQYGSMKACQTGSHLHHTDSCFAYYISIKLSFLNRYNGNLQICYRFIHIFFSSLILADTTKPSLLCSNWTKGISMIKCNFMVMLLLLVSFLSRRLLRVCTCVNVHTCSTGLRASPAWSIPEPRWIIIVLVFQDKYQSYYKFQWQSCCCWLINHTIKLQIHHSLSTRVMPILEVCQVHLTLI